MGWGPVDQDLVTFHIEYEMLDITLQQLPHSELDKRTNIRQESRNEIWVSTFNKPFCGHHFLIYLYSIVSNRTIYRLFFRKTKAQDGERVAFECDDKSQHTHGQSEGLTSANHQTTNHHRTKVISNAPG